MFTGLVEDAGTIVRSSPDGGGRVLAIRTRIPLTEVAIGDSIACDGVCLTVESLDGDVFTVTCGRETLDLTTLGGSRPGDAVHLERALRLGDRLGGHWVQGHVDGLGRVVSSQQTGESRVVWIELEPSLSRYVAAKGSVCLHGVSLTVNEVDGDRFRVNLIPHTSSVTRLADRAPGQLVNVEVDILAKYVERLLGAAQPGKGLTLQQLRDGGFA